jgi:protein gp37
MSTNSSIEWTQSTWNPLTGCSKVSPGCKYCYAELLSKRLKAMGQPNYQNEFQLTLHENNLELPMKWKKPKYIFVNSMSDLFHEDVPIGFIKQVFEIMRNAYWHKFQVLTKRSERLAALESQLVWAPNIWMGVSVENQDYESRINDLKKTKAAVKYISFEPLLGPISNVNFESIDWVIVGGESGPKARPIQDEWVFQIRDSCINSNIPFFFKQWGGTRRKKSGRLLQGRVWDEMPVANEMRIVNYG